MASLIANVIQAVCELDGNIRMCARFPSRAPLRVLSHSDSVTDPHETSLTQGLSTGHRERQVLKMCRRAAVVMCKANVIESVVLHRELSQQMRPLSS